MKVAYVSILSAEDPNTWSGLNFSIANCLRREGIDVTLVGPLYNPPRAFLSKARSKFRQVTSGRQFLWTRHTRLLRAYSREVARRLAYLECDVIFSPGTEAVAYLPHHVRTPVVLWTDASIGSMVDYYPWYRGLAPQCLAEAMECDTRVLRRAALACYTSEWAADAAIKLHGAQRDRVAVVPFGPNLASTVRKTEIAGLVSSRLRFPWKFLLVGVDWERKGGDLALAIVGELNRRGFPSELNVVGCHPPRTRAVPPYLKLHGFVNRQDESGRTRLTAFFRDSTFFLLPSLADATPVVYCEAMAHALPCIGTWTGGIPSVVRDGITGHLPQPGASVDEYVRRILESTDPIRYEAMARAAQHDSATRLNWDSSGARLKELLEERIAKVCVQ